MAVIELPSVRDARTIEEKIEALYDAYAMLRKELLFALQGNLDDDNVSSITTDLLIAGTAKIDTALIENLEVGTNVTMGANATITWNNVSDKPSDLVYDADLATALSAYITDGELSNALLSYVTGSALTTTLGQDYIITGKILANQVTAGTLTGFTIQTAGSGTRLVMNSSGIISYNSSSQKSGVTIEDGSYSYGAVDFYHAGVKVGSLYYDTFGGMRLSALGGAIMYPEGTWNFSGAIVTGLDDLVAEFG